MFPEAWLWATIEAATGHKAYPANVPRENTPPPYVVFSRERTTRDRHLMNNGGVPVASIVVVCVSLKYLDAKSIANTVRRAVDSARDVPIPGGGMIESVALVDEADGEPVQYGGDDAPLYSVVLSFDVRFTEEV